MSASPCAKNANNVSNNNDFERDILATRMKTIALVSPAANEEEVIENFYRAAKAVLNQLSDRYSHQIIIVADGCTDQTVPILKQLAEQDDALKVVVLSSRFGHQNALLAGLDQCNADAVIMMDSDLQHPPELIPQLLAEWERGYDIVYTVREDRTDQLGFFKQFTSRTFYRLINRMSDVPINEGAADFRLASRRVVEVFQTQMRERNQFLRGLFTLVGFKQVAVHFQVRRRAGGKSKYSVGKMLRFARNGLVSFSKKPLTLASIAGSVLLLMGVLIGVVTLIAAARESVGWQVVLTALFVIGGVQLLSVGLLGEYLGAVLDEVKARPHYIIEERVNF